MFEYKSNRELLEEFNIYVKGHEEAKKAIINLVNRSKIRYHQKYRYLDNTNNLLDPYKILLIGKSGHGKTHLVEVAAKLMDFPLIKIDATTLTPTGNDRGINSAELRKMIEDKAKYLIKTYPHYHSEQGVIDQTVVFVDEIDKIAKPFESSGGWNKHVQDNFLTLFDDRGVFAGVSFIFAGAFTEIYSQIKPQNSIGFRDSRIMNNDKIEWDQEIVKYGLIPELVGRITGIYKIDDLTKQDYKHILENILLPKKQDELVYYNNIEFNITIQQKEQIIDIAHKSGQGVRSLKREIDKLFTDLQFYYEDVCLDKRLLENMMEKFENQFIEDF